MQGRILHVEGFEGKVVAIDMTTDHVVASANSFEELMLIVRSLGISDAMVLRVPEVDAPLRVGLG